RRDLALALLSIADGGLRLRRIRLPRRRPDLRRPRRVRPAPRGSAPPRHPRHRRPRPGPYVRPAPVVPRGTFFAHRSQARLLRLGRPAARPTAEQLARRLQTRRGRLDVGPEDRPVLPAPFPGRAARPQLVERKSPRG